MAIASASGVVPAIGDTAKAASKVGEFITKNIDKTDDISELLIRLNKNFPDDCYKLIPTESLDEVEKLLDNTDKLSKSEYSSLKNILEKCGKNVDDYTSNNISIIVKETAELRPYADEITDIVKYSDKDDEFINICLKYKDQIDDILNILYEYKNYCDDIIAIINKTNNIIEIIEFIQEYKETAINILYFIQEYPFENENIDEKFKNVILSVKSKDYALKISEKYNYNSKTVASNLQINTLSGYKDESFNEITRENNILEKIMNKSKEIGHSLSTHNFDNGINCSYYACHAEKQLSLLTKAPIGITNPMCFDCKSYFSKLAKFENRTIYTADTKNVRIFYPNGIIDEIPY